jgi:hypothetical protein
MELAVLLTLGDVVEPHVGLAQKAELAKGALGLEMLLDAAVDMS